MNKVTSEYTEITLKSPQYKEENDNKSKNEDGFLNLFLVVALAGITSESSIYCYIKDTFNCVDIFSYNWLWYRVCIFPQILSTAGANFCDYFDNYLPKLGMFMWGIW